MKRLLLLICILSFSISQSQEWEKYKNLELEFIADFNGEIKTLEQDIPVENTTIKMTMIYVDNSANPNSSNTIYAVARSDYDINSFLEEDDARDQQILNEAVQGAAINVRGQVISKESFVFNGFPARRTKIEMTGAFIYANVYLIRNIIYFTQVICITEKDNNPDIQRFLDSFEIIKTK